MANSDTTTPSLAEPIPINNDLKPWSTTDIPTLSPALDNYYDWSSIVQAMVDFHDATHLLTTNPTPLEQRLAKQLVFFLSRTVASTHRPALLGQTPAAAWSILQALNPQTGHSLEDLVQRGYDICLADIGPTSYATQHRIIQSQIVQQQAAHHYATPQAYINRVLKGMEGHPDVRHVRTTFRNITQPTLADVENLYREIADSCTDTTLPRAHAASSKDRRNRGSSKYTRPPRDPTVTDYNCSFCKVDNHITRDCRRKNRYRTDANTSGYKNTVEIANAVAIALATMFSSPTSNTSGAQVNEPKSPYPRLPRYLLDSAASITMHPTRRPFRNYQPSNTSVLLADQRTTPAIGEGPSTIPTNGRPLHIPRALHVPHLQDHLVSAAQIAFNNDILFQGSKVYILQPGPKPEPSKVLTKGKRNQGVYELETRPHQAAFISNVTHPFKIPSNIAHLHNTFNHTSARNIGHLIQKNPNLRPLEQSHTGTVIETCVPCLEGKQTRAPFRSTDKPSEVLSRVSTDLCGPLPLSSQGARHLQVVIDNKSNYTAGLLLARKDQAPILLSNLLRSWATTTGRPVKSVLSDNAKELTCKTLQDFYDAQGITPLTTAPYSSSQNGQAERAIRTIQNATRSALSFSKLPARYWDYAALDAITKGNVQPSPATKNTPYNIFHNTTSTPVAHFHPFGQWGYVTNVVPWVCINGYMPL
jgi:transposase InsO family protein